MQVTVEVYSEHRGLSKSITTELDSICIKHSISHKHILSVKGTDYKIQFYAPTWLYGESDPRRWKEWNRHCGKIRTKRYIHLYKKKTLLDQINYINDIISIGGGYLIKIDKGHK